jgi:hypothetical protein
MLGVTPLMNWSPVWMTAWQKLKKVLENPTTGAILLHRPIFGKNLITHNLITQGGGAIWNGIHFETPVIPAKAGIQSVVSLFPKTCGVDSCFRGNDCGLQRPCPADDTSAITQGHLARPRS